MLIKNSPAAVSYSARNFSANANFRLYTCGLAILGLLLSGGCTSIKVALGLRTRLQKVPVTALAPFLYPGPGLAPGKSARLIIRASTTDGNELTTVGPGHGKVLFDSFTFESTVVQVSKKGVVSMAADPRVSEGKLPHIRMTAIGHPDVVADLDVPLRYDADYKADFSGKAGADGADGSSGMDGSAGSNRTSGQGGDGGDGGPGGDGQNGGDGEPGKAVHVWLTLKAGSHPLLQARVTSDADEKLFLIDPNGGSLEIDTNGGAGGKGGDGGRGGAGGAGGDGDTTGRSGNDGSNGSPGGPGQGGAAGTIIVSVDPQAKPFLDRLHLTNHDGNGMPGDAPEIRVEPVPAIW
jgi:hypothetical protein